MKIVRFTDLYKMDYSILRVVAFYQRWDNTGYFATPSSGRSNSGLSYFVDCETEYRSDGHPVVSAVRGDISLVPQGTAYACRFRNCGEPVTQSNAYLINFELFDDAGEPFALDGFVHVIRPSNSAHYFERFQEIMILFSQAAAPTARIKACLYQLLTDISFELRKMTIARERFADIIKGIVYLEQHYTSAISVPELAEMCHVSETYFRRLFKQYAGMPPLDYAIDLRMKKAKLMLESGASSVAEVAYALGFDDLSYFSRLYKRRLGIPPRTSLYMARRG
ncbi:MAG TPA: AraC family transcriptional regulator [Armatimonadota bacterium]|nr:AraC family transcriptional regulator [Armatimonadota bacterium]